MKPLYLLLAVLLFTLALPNLVSAQSVQGQPDYGIYARKKFFDELELHGGPAIGFLRGNMAVEKTPNRTPKLKLGYSFGIGATHVMNDRLLLNCKLLFERKGQIIKTTTTSFDEATQTFVHYDTRANYIYDYYSVPITLLYSFNKPSNFRIGLGLFAGYLKKQIIEHDTPALRSVPSTIDLTKYNTKFDFGATLSINYQIPINSKLSAQIQLLNNLGLLNTGRHLYDNMKTNNTSLLIGLVSKRK